MSIIFRTRPQVLRFTIYNSPTIHQDNYANGYKAEVATSLKNEYAPRPVERIEQILQLILRLTREGERPF